MKNVLCRASAAAAALAFCSHALAQNCYPGFQQCWSFAPRGSEVDRVPTGLSLRSKELLITGDLRVRLRGANAPSDAPYQEADQQATRARVQLGFQATDKVRAKVEFLFAESWAGSESYSDSLGGLQGAPNEQYNKVSQAYALCEDLLGLGEVIRVGRSDFFLSNGLILGSCDFLQFPSTFTGAWAGRKFGPVEVEGFLFDDYGPLQNGNLRDGTRFAGGSAKWTVSDDGPIGLLSAYFLTGTGDGDLGAGVAPAYQDYRNDSWWGLDGKGSLPLGLNWMGELAQRIDEDDTGAAGDIDPLAYRMRVAKPVGGVVTEVSLTRTESEGSLQINPGDFNSAGLLHQYAGAWRSDLDTWQLGCVLDPGLDLDVTLTVLTLDHDGASGGGINRQLGHFESNAIVAKTLDTGVHIAAGYAIDNDERQVGYLQLTVYF
jgi:hypothetical protein